MEGTLPRLLFVVPDPDERGAVREAIAALDVEIVLDLVPDGVGLPERLARDGLPDLCFLDLGEPEGMPLLGALRGSAATRALVVIGLSRSWSQEAIDRAYSSGANAWLMMPLTHTELMDLLHRALDFWLGAAQLPTGMAR